MTSRIETAIEEGSVTLPEAGRIAVFRPRAGLDLAPLGRERVQIVQGFRPDHDAFAAAGWDVAVAPSGAFGAAMVCATRSRDETRALVSEARSLTDGPVIVDGQKTDGIESLLRELRKRAEVGPVTSKAHGKIFAVTGGDFADWRLAPITVEGFRTVPGVFSAEKVDAGSRALAEALPAKLTGRGADLGAGWGFLSAAVLEKGVTELHLVEAEHSALECARVNVTDPRAHFHWADVGDWTPPAPLDFVVTNPPFHQGREADPGIGRGFIAAAARMLKPSGRLWLVANRHLPYEAAARAAFANVTEIGGAGGFKILLAEKPRRGGR